MQAAINSIPMLEAFFMPLTIGEKIAEARTAAGYRTQTDAAKESRKLQSIDPKEWKSFSQQWLSALEETAIDAEDLDGIHRLRLKTLLHIIKLEALPVAPDPLEPYRIKLDLFPVPRLGLVAAGDAEGDMPEPDGTFEQVPLESLKKKGCDTRRCYAYTVNGNSMFTEASRRNPRPLAHGDVVVIERGRIAQKDDLVVLWDHEMSKMLIKEIDEGENGEYLVFTSFNTAHPPIVRTRDQVRVYGVVVWRGG
jgi:SOS-response transcriptional repressor LexA